MKPGYLEEKVKEISEPLIRDFGMELVDAAYLHESGRWVLRIFIDKPGGVTLDDCSSISRELGTLLDVENIMPRAYVLEVSSPGIDRPLIKEKDFVNATGKKINLKTKQPIEGRRNFKVVVVGVTNDKVVLKDSEGRVLEIELSNVDKARCEVEI
ncbi:MAG: ribosome maturation factor RimP [Thermodesulfobacteriota bacterium]